MLDLPDISNWVVFLDCLIFQVGCIFGLLDFSIVYMCAVLDVLLFLYCFVLVVCIAALLGF